MNSPEIALRDAVDAFLHASILLEEIIPGTVVSDLDGLRLIRFGRLRAGVGQEIIADNRDPAEILAVLARRPDPAAAFLTTFAPLGVERQAVYENAGLQRVVRNTLMICSLAGGGQQPDPQLHRLTDPADLHRLARIRADNVLDVDAFTDAVRCYALDIDGDLVSSAVLVPSIHHVAVIEHVHTLTAYRRRGYGRWLMRALHTEAARTGMRQIVLGSNEAGRPLYDALGYRALCVHDVFVVGQSSPG